MLCKPSDKISCVVFNMSRRGRGDEDGGFQEIQNGPNVSHDMHHASGVGRGPLGPEPAYARHSAGTNAYGNARSSVLGGAFGNGYGHGYGNGVDVSGCRNVVGVPNASNSMSPFLMTKNNRNMGHMDDEEEALPGKLQTLISNDNVIKFADGLCFEDDVHDSHVSVCKNKSNKSSPATRSGHGMSAKDFKNNVSSTQSKKENAYGHNHKKQYHSSSNDFMSGISRCRTPYRNK